jgi:hypothetical protein
MMARSVALSGDGKMVFVTGRSGGFVAAQSADNERGLRHPRLRRDDG